MTLKEHLLNSPKENVYAFYQRLEPLAQEYTKITRKEIYNHLLYLYKIDPEHILRLSSLEEINILKNLLEGEIEKKDNGYIDYLLFENLRANYLIGLENNKYYIYPDIYNYVKMAMNLLDEELYATQDIFDSIILGCARVYNTLPISNFLSILKNYSFTYDFPTIKKYIQKSPKLNHKVKIIKYQKENYLISLEHYYYQDVLKLRQEIEFYLYSLEEIISFGKYNLNLFKEEVFEYLNFLESHLFAPDIHYFLQDLIFYCGFEIKDDNILNNICGAIEELFKETKKVSIHFPIWIYNGHTLNTLREFTK